MYWMEFKMPLPPAKKKKKTLACVREIPVHKLWTKVYGKGWQLCYYLLSSKLTALILHVILNERLYPFFLQGILWNSPTALFGCYTAGDTSNCCRLCAHSMSTTQPCISLQCDFIPSHIRRVHCVFSCSLLPALLGECLGHFQFRQLVFTGILLHRVNFSCAWSRLSEHDLR